MAIPANWQSPITASVGQFQTGVNPLQLLPSRTDVFQVRLDMQAALLDAGIGRHTPIKVSLDGVIWDGHHLVRVAAERRIDVTVQVVKQRVQPSASSILDLPVR
jgi:hypothetical protein